MKVTIATLCFIRDKNKTLMMKRVPEKDGKWNGLGGKLEYNETPEECVIREVYEESGLQIQNPEFKGRIAFYNTDKPESTFQVYVFLAHSFTGNLLEPDLQKEGQLEWKPSNKLKNLDMYEGDKVFIPWLDEIGVFSAKFNYDRDTLKSHTVVFHKT